METCSVWVNTACLQAERLAPDSKLTQIADFLKGLGFGTTEIQQIVEEDDDQVKTRLNDLDRMARALGYAPERIRQIREELDNRRQRESPIMIMGYELAPVPEKNARALRSITDALAEIDCHIARIASLAQQPVKHLIERYGHKRVIDELARRHSDLESFQATRYLANFDSGLASNVFRSSGSRFKPMDAYQLVEFDTKNDPRWEAAPRLNSLVAQYAIWAATDNYGLDEAVKRITISADKRRLIAAGVRTVLRRAPGRSGEGVGTWRLRSKTIRFAQSRIVRVAGRMLGI
jgi:DNA-binding transcriptional MerR regulator